jgi:protein-S-isoprenylcysteine O-methyltransferase Ste14
MESSPKDTETQSAPTAMRTFRHILGLVTGFGFHGVIMPFAIYHVNLFCDRLLGVDPFGDFSWRKPVAIVFLVIGLLFVFWANTYLVMIGKGGPFNYHRVVKISPKTERLVTGGPYRFTRNPMAFGAFTAYLSIPIFIGSISGIILFFFFFLLALRYFKHIEEPRLLEEFGEEYARYKERVSQVIPLPPRSKNKGDAA